MRLRLLPRWLDLTHQPKWSSRSHRPRCLVICCVVSKVWSLAGSGLKKKKQQKETTGRAKRRARYEASTNTRAKRTAKSNDEKVIPPFANVFDARKRSRDTKRSRFPPTKRRDARRTKEKKKRRRRRRRRRRGKKARTRWQFPRLRSRSRLARFFSIVVERTLLRFLCVCERVKCVFCARRKVPLIFEKNLL